MNIDIASNTSDRGRSSFCAVDVGVLALFALTQSYTKSTRAHYARGFLLIGVGYLPSVGGIIYDDVVVSTKTSASGANDLTACDSHIVTRF
jgi:hypothetical protein